MVHGTLFPQVMPKMRTKEAVLVEAATSDSANVDCMDGKMVTKEASMPIAAKV